MDRITRVRIANVRAIQDVDLAINRPISVLIGENGSGKSTMIECLELLRKAASPGFMQQLYQIHGGLPSLLRKGASSLELGIVIEDDAGEHPRLDYAFALSPQHTGAHIALERLWVGPTDRDNEPLVALSRTPSHCHLLDESSGSPVPVDVEHIRPDQLVVSGFGQRSPLRDIDRLLAVLRGIEVHLRFDALATWAARSYQYPPGVRGASTLFPTKRLDLLCTNLANAWFELQQQDDAHWERTMAYVRLGLGESVDRVIVEPDKGGGAIYLAMRFHHLAEPILASGLSDGQLGWLAFVAIARRSEHRSLLAIDEPENHLHPHLIAGMVALLTSVDAPVVVATHADRVLESLEHPDQAIRVCSLDAHGNVGRIRQGEPRLPRPATNALGNLANQLSTI